MFVTLNEQAVAAIYGAVAAGLFTLLGVIVASLFAARSERVKFEREEKVRREQRIQDDAVWTCGEILNMTNEVVRRVDQRRGIGLNLFDWNRNYDTREMSSRLSSLKNQVDVTMPEGLGIRATELLRAARGSLQKWKTKEQADKAAINLREAKEAFEDEMRNFRGLNPLNRREFDLTDPTDPSV
ncbi:hypothetical protein ACLQ2Q_21750 [Microbacterium sp. DT81.1]|uniref:hypothetical protein n=1 Tax=Microbacterium sp. DT81.1 TaxID=3393413 RepID=UPI003CE6D32E